MSHSVLKASQIQDTKQRSWLVHCLQKRGEISFSQTVFRQAERKASLLFLFPPKYPLLFVVFSKIQSSCTLATKFVDCLKSHCEIMGFNLKIWGLYLHMSSLTWIFEVCTVPITNFSTGYVKLPLTSLHILNLGLKFYCFKWRLWLSPRRQ